VRRRTMAALVGAVALLTGLVAGAGGTPASAATGECGGRLVGSYPIGSAGSVDVYYSSASGGTNCLRAVTGGNAWGQGYRIGVGVAKSPSRGFPSEPRPPTDFCDYMYWRYNWNGGNDAAECGPFDYYAGPIQITGTASRCIDFHGRIWLENGNKYYSAYYTGRHCG
jgi:hypothetical protein